MILNRLYDVDLVEMDGQHFYEVDNNKTYFPGVTGILNVIAKPALVPWAAKETADYIYKVWGKIDGRPLTDRFKSRLYSRSKKQAKFTKETAARRGSEAHRIFDNILNSKPEEPNGYLESFRYFMSHENIKIIAGDTKIASIEFGYGGSLDALGVNKEGDLVIVDFKTGKSLYDTHALQVAAYGKALMETFGITKMPKGLIIKFVNENKKYERAEVRDMNDSFEAFRTALQLSKLLNTVQFSEKITIKPKKEKIRI